MLKLFPKFGIQKRASLLKNRQSLRILSLDTLQHWINRKRLDPSRPITLKEIAESKVAGKVKDGVVLLANVIFVYIGSQCAHDSSSLGGQQGLSRSDYGSGKVGW